MENKDVLYAKWLNGEISDDALRKATGEDTVQELKRVVDTVDNWSTKPYDTSRGFEKYQQKQQTHSGKGRRINLFRIASIAASIAIFAVCWVAFFNTNTATLKAGQGEQVEYVFVDESSVHLNAGSSIEYTKDWSEERRINLVGEGVFQVQSGKPFIVTTAQGTVTVLGTQFNVRAWGSQFIVECYEGKVQVEVENQKSILTANESVTVASGIMQQKISINYNSPSWEQGTSRFRNESLSAVCQELMRQYAVEVTLEATEREFSGNFPHDNLDKALNSICKPLGLSYSLSQDKRSVVIE